MFESLRALVVIFFISLPCIWFSKLSFGSLAAGADWNRRWIAWFALTGVAFLARDPWLYVAGTALVIGVGVQAGVSLFSLYMALLFALPELRVEIPGVGSINYFFELNHIRMLGALILIPAWLLLRRQPGTPRFGAFLPDRLLALYMLLIVLMQLRETTLTDVMRRGLAIFLEGWLPYYVASRSCKDLKAFRDVLATFVTSSCLMASVAVFEVLKGWLLYASLPRALGVPGFVGGYMARDDSMRAVASSGHAIVLGYIQMAALGFYSYVRHLLVSKLARNAVFLVLGAGLFLPLSRGPWVGAVVVLLAWVCFQRNMTEVLAKVLIVLLVASTVVFMTPAGEKFVRFLPWIGAHDSGSVDYRENLWKNGMIVFERNPLLGSVNYLEAPEMISMIQAEGIIDMVNSYLGIALEYGLIGLVLFAGVFVSAGYSALLARRRLMIHGEEYGVLGAALICVLLGCMVTIATVSNIVFIPVVCWLVAGFCVAYSNLKTSAPGVPARQSV